MYQTLNKGFTLIEVLIVVAIIGLLASIAVPSYSSYLTNARRLDGQVALRGAAQFMERCRTQSFTYVGCNTNTTAPAPSTSEDGHYELTYSSVAAATYTITATPPTGSKQSHDSECTTLTINQTGATGYTPAATAAGVCW